MSETGNVDYERLVDTQFCKSITENEKGKTARKRDCLQAVKNMCCYLCSQQESCETSCDYLGQREKTLTQEPAGQAHRHDSGLSDNIKPDHHWRNSVQISHNIRPELGCHDI